MPKGPKPAKAQRQNPASVTELVVGDNTLSYGVVEEIELLQDGDLLIRFDSRARVAFHYTSELRLVP